MEDSINVEDFDSLGNEENEETEEVPLTAAEVIELMEEAWRNEKFAPDILPNKSEVVDCLLGQISYMEENLRNLKTADFQKSIHQLEVDRLRFLVSSYLRQRLQKIEAYTFIILRQEEQRLEQNEELYLTNNELEFARSYKESIEQHFDDILSFWPGVILVINSHIERTNEQTIVFERVKDIVNFVKMNLGQVETVQILRTIFQHLVLYFVIDATLKENVISL
ncbi:sld5 protein [Holotrichia oblita]|uniref:Sld5 protein n=1 Tax=Holotrichia oblita TaxID=644536 RepID=A0ACB9TF63_HOLOL|nr:sld5 protein [Holotrichia oblita]